MCLWLRLLPGPHRKSYSARSAPHPLSWFPGSRFATDEGRGRKRKEGRKEGDGSGGKRRVAFSRILLFKFNHLEKYLE